MSTKWALFERAAAPDVDNPDEDYMVRLRLVQTPWFGICIHRINTPDNARPIPHTHPWWFASFILRGGYTECFERRDRTGRLLRHWPRRSRRAGRAHVVRASDAHTITHLHRSPTWTLVLVGRRRPEPSWGYWDRDSFTPWDEHPYAERFAAALAARRGSRRQP
jgi:hypothetical protein